MKPVTVRLIFRWIGLGCILALLGAGLSVLSPDAAAQDPTPLPTPTLAPTWTPQATPAASPTSGVPVGPTPIVPTATLSNRLIDFRVDDDEIRPGACVQFSWVVRGDIDRVEFDQREDNKDPLLVPNSDSREECPAEDTSYRLTVLWLDGTRNDQVIEIDTSLNADEDDDDEASADGGTGGTAVPGAVGEFIVVTPILITTGTPTPNPAPGAQEAAFQQTLPEELASAPPGGPLSSVKALPETGVGSPASGPSPAAVGSLLTIILAGLGLLAGVSRRAR